ncbi:hypothetical protein IU433_01960 [Nocardia puris]|uniref:Uncharacterized protein n=1 Tax=Nocardia puris TaxID=208602 RepID=A0A366DV57_9NOCA|nr:hypothetical protein [Nocardia puris]MBF6210552.1 hypothetical protein [Nocardia puris]MBF6369277.1 hypothetical protein [Nocardia puris]MBF6457812.1 hypothetical protein [Nocardia puris]RBO93980.1 hypothetical protein DFR74_102400 [Nocardia puris]
MSGYAQSFGACRWYGVPAEHRFGAPQPGAHLVGVAGIAPPNPATTRGRRLRDAVARHRPARVRKVSMFTGAALVVAALLVVRMS